MLRFLLRRVLVEMPLSLLVIFTITFFLIRLAPGGPFSAEKTVSPQVLRELKRHYGLDRPLYVQYVNYLGSVLRGDLGPSFKYPGRKVTELIAEAFPVSFELGCYALFFALLFGCTAGMIAASRNGTGADFLVMFLSMGGICIPSFVLGPLLVLVFGLLLGWLPVAGWTSPADRILPSITLGMIYVAYIARMMRGSLLEVLVQDFIKTARAKGLTERRILLRHALRGAMVPVVSFLGPAAAGLITGSFVVETIFSIPGLGRFFVTAAFNRDYTLILGTVVFYAVIIMVFNMLVDILLAILDPRIRSGGGYAHAG
ncbi:MAG: ABC transporter permease subunit [Chitinispirillaceae bacterium]|nr:ABC transporter permease subunit [Chitinispirillaceae bacterium]